MSIDDRRFRTLLVNREFVVSDHDEMNGGDRYAEGFRALLVSKAL